MTNLFQTFTSKQFANVGRRILFVLLSTAVCVFFSEKMYWYPQGYAIVELIFFYAVPVYAVIWAIAYFRVQTLSGILLIASLYAFLVEGVLTPVIFEGGLLDPILPAYFIGWHGVLALLFGWFYLRKWLVEGAWRKLWATAVCLGIFWGVWSTGYWLPEQASDWAHLDKLQSPVWQFGLHAFTFTLLLISAHWALNKLGFPTTFTPTRGEKWLLFLLLSFFFVTLSVPGAPFGFVKLGVLVTAVLLPLALRRRWLTDSALIQLQGDLTNWQLAGILWMPGTAVCTYALFAYLQPNQYALRAINELITIGQWIMGAGLLIGAWGIEMYQIKKRITPNLTHH